MLRDCKCFPSLNISRKPFFTLHVRLKLALQLSICGSSMSYFISLFYIPSDYGNTFWVCQIQGLMAQLSPWLTFTYSIAIAFWLMIWVIFVNAVRNLTARKKFIMEIVTHGLVWTASILFSAIPFTTNSYGVVSSLFLWNWLYVILLVTSLEIGAGLADQQRPVKLCKWVC